MRISNVGLFVKDLEGARKFFEDFFGAQVHATYEEDDGYKSYIMKFDENPKLELMSKPTVVDEKKDPNRTGFVHICIKVDSARSSTRSSQSSRLPTTLSSMSRQRTAAMRSAPSRLRTTSSRSAAKWQHRTITSSAFAGYFLPILRFEKIEIHKVFLHFSNLASTKNLSPNAFAELCGAAQNHRRRNYNERKEQAVF